jgi:hypothetical protein
MIFAGIIAKMTDPPSWKKSNWKKNSEIAGAPSKTPTADDV